MEERVDAGDILKQVVFPIAARETAHTLNFKCHITAVGAFAELVEELNSGKVRRMPQQPGSRTFFPRSKKPTRDCLIPWEWTADRIDSFCRALDFGPTPNPIGLPKVSLGGDRFELRRIEICEGRSGALPGTILKIGEKFVRVATGSEDILLKDFKTLDGREVNPFGLGNRTALVPGAMFDRVC
jgi:methionyl-tRNA formyltransferase